MFTSLFGAAGVTITPNSTGLPGVGTFEHIVGTLIVFGVIASVAGLLISAITWAVGHHSANPNVMSKGKQGTITALVAALLCGGAMALVNFVFGIGGTL